MTDRTLCKISKNSPIAAFSGFLTRTELKIVTPPVLKKKMTRIWACEQTSITKTRTVEAMIEIYANKAPERNQNYQANSKIIG